MVPTPPRVTQRLLASLQPEGDCLVSSYSTGSHGYSQIGWQQDDLNHTRLGHRVAWEAVRGPIPDDLTVDHICRNRRCCNVEHLRLLPNVDNARDNGPARRTHCPQGHQYDEANTYVNPRGHRFCRACMVRWRRSAMSRSRCTSPDAGQVA